MFKVNKIPSSRNPQQINRKTKAWIIPEIWDSKNVHFNETEHNIYSPFYSINDKLFKKIIFSDLLLTIDISKEKNKYLLLKDNSLVVVNKIVEKNVDHSINFLVKKFLNFKEFIAKPFSSIDVGIYIVNINELSNSYLINISDVKYKMFYVRLSGNEAVMNTLCHDV